VQITPDFLQCILHRDVSSANVLLQAVRNDMWLAKLSDFGSANLSHLASTPFEGAAVYSAPEVSTEDRSRQTAKIDVYSFGVLVCEVCLCRFPPERAQFPSMLSDMRHTAPNLFPVSRDCTSHAHQDRPTMREVLQRIDQI
jgi:serine/threonine protein kinase